MINIIVNSFIHTQNFRYQHHLCIYFITTCCLLYIHVIQHIHKNNKIFSYKMNKVWKHTWDVIIIIIHLKFLKSKFVAFLEKWSFIYSFSYEKEKKKKNVKNFCHNSNFNNVHFIRVLTQKLVYISQWNVHKR